MEKAPTERKPNRVFRGRIIRAAIAEALGFGNSLIHPKPESPPTTDIGYEEIGIGAMDAGQLTIYDEPKHWHNWPS